MPLYEYYCPTCSQKFEILRPMSRSDEPAPCPEGHAGAERVVSLFASFSKAGDGSIAPVGGSPCTACSAGTCNTCSVAP
jgi:putative FmdB family regulatory protein